MSQPPLVAHVIYKLDFGGLENGLVNLINRMPPERYRHAVVCITDYTNFRSRIKRDDVAVIALHKQPGRDWKVYARMWQALRELRPTIVHTRNVAGLDAVVPAFLAGVRGRVHGEHGRDMYDLHGQNRRHQWLRRGLAPLIDRFVPLSRDLERWLTDEIGISSHKMRRICNGVDITRFSVRGATRQPIVDSPFNDNNYCVIGSVGRMQAVKDPMNLAQAFVLLLQRRPDLRAVARLAMIGDGALHPQVAQFIQAQGVADLAWLPGARNDVPELLRHVDVFALPSLAEGISNTILEAMASGLPMVATEVGGNGELIDAGATGLLVPAADAEALSKALECYVDDVSMRQRHGQAGRQRVEQQFSIAAMVQRYQAVYDELIN
jgi:sugar transferase (PEP-CTERM/EpsH1 system associated)